MIIDVSVIMKMNCELKVWFAQAMENVQLRIKRSNWHVLKAAAHITVKNANAVIMNVRMESYARTRGLSVLQIVGTIRNCLR